MMPDQKRGESKQDYETPEDLLEPTKDRFCGTFDFDLAATDENKKASHCFTIEDNSLEQDWLQPNFRHHNFWLNPPFANIAPWAAKCREFAKQSVRLGNRGRIFFLTPASVGANWYVEHVRNYSYVCFLQGRPTFVGETTCYPKDCMISIFGQGIVGDEVWKWKKLK